MRRVLFAALAAVTVSATLLPVAAHAQTRGQDGTGQTADGSDGQERRRAPRIAPLRRQPNAGPCPYVKILYDAARYVEMTGDRVSAANVGFTGEIEGLTSGCAYRSDEPITVEINLLFNLGRGPQAQGDARTYRYWIAVTERDTAILAKQYFDLPVQFEDGADRTYAEAEQTVTIPRAAATTSGSNFEILVGFDVTPDMAEFNRTGSRFRINAGQSQAQASASAPQ